MKDYWNSLNMYERNEFIKTAIKNGFRDPIEIRKKYNEFAEGGPLKEWKALGNIDFEAIPDTTFTRDKTGAGSIEYFQAKYPQGVTYPNGYHKKHPKPGKDVILYNPNENDEQDIRLDALHIMPKDATYDVLNTLYRNAAKGTDVEWNAIQRYEEDVRKYGVPNIDPYESYFNNEADGLLRNMFIEGTPEYIKSKRYYPDKEQLAEWNKPLLGYINEIKKYLETGKRPKQILPEIVVTPENNNSYSEANSFEGGGFINPYKHGDVYNASPECAYFSNHTLNDQGYMMSGNAWTPRGVDVVFDGFNSDLKPKKFSEKAYDNFAVDAVNNVYTNFNTRETLDPNQVYTVNMFYKNSPNKEKAFKESNGAYGTHTGYLNYEPEDDTWYVTHNIHNKIYKQRFGDLQNPKGNVGVTAIYKPRKNNLFNRVITKLGFAEGGELFTKI